MWSPGRGIVLGEWARHFNLAVPLSNHSGVEMGNGKLLRPIYTVRFFLAIIACDRPTTQLLHESRLLNQQQQPFFFVLPGEKKVQIITA